MGANQKTPEKTRKLRFGRDGGGLPPNLERTLAFTAILFAIVGIILISIGTRQGGGPATITTPYPAVPVSTIIEAAESGGVVSAGIPLTPSSTIAAVAQMTPEWFQSNPDVTGSEEMKVSFFVSEAGSYPLTTELVAAGVEVWYAPTPTRTAVGVGSRAGMVTPAAGGTYSLSPTSETSTNPGGPLIISGFVMIGLGVSILVFILLRRRQRNQAAAAAAAVAEATTPQITFADVAGCDEAIEQMRELVDFLKNPEKYEELGAKIPKGALLCGPPGTGKTLLARALAGEAGVPLHVTSGSGFTEMYVGVGPKRVRELFARARKTEKSIIFIDEIDAVARKRSSGDNNGAQESENTLNALLTEMDGFHKGNTVIVIAATNRPDILDPALTRPGRLERRIEVPLPDRRGREHVLRVHAGRVPLSPDVDLEVLARRTPGFSGAQLESVINEAALDAVRRGLSEVDSAAVDSAVAHVAMGRARTSAVVTDHDREITAWHEAGHLVCGLLLKDADIPVSVSIVPRGPAGGVTWFSEGDDIFMTRAKAHARLTTAMGGRAAEQLLLDGEYTQGASGDIQSATNIALSMAVQYGMTRLGLAARDQYLGGPNSSEVAEVVEELLSAALAEAADLLSSNRALVTDYAEALLEFGDLDRIEIEQIANRHGIVAQGTPTPLTPLPKHAARPASDSRDQVEAEIHEFIPSTWREVLARLIAGKNKRGAMN